MKSWYITREAGNLNHRNQIIPEGKKILLTEAQAKLHNTKSEKVAKCEPPKEAKEVGVLTEWEEYKKSEVRSQKSEVTESQSSTKAKGK